MDSFYKFTKTLRLQVLKFKLSSRQHFSNSGVRPPRGRDAMLEGARMIYI